MQYTLSNINTQFKFLSGLNPNIVFYLSLVVFFLDRLANQWGHIPIFTLYLGVLLPLLLYKIAVRGGIPRLLILLLVCLVVCSLIHIFKYSIKVKSLSDALYVSSFAVSYYFYDRYSEDLKAKAVWVLAVVMCLMFSVSFLPGNSPLFAEKENQEKIGAYLKPSGSANATEFTLGAKLEKKSTISFWII